MIDEKKLIEDIHEYFKRHIDNIYCKDADGDKTVILNFNADIHRIVENQPKVGEWIPCGERLPKIETEVEISCIRRCIVGNEKKVYRFTARAFYTDGTMTTGDSAFTWNDCDNWEYDEEKDDYIIPEGWWEGGSFSEEFGVVDAEVIAWKPLSLPYREEKDRKWED